MSGPVGGGGASRAALAEILDVAMVALMSATATGGERGSVNSWVANTNNFTTKTGATFSSDHYANPAIVEASIRTQNLAGGATKTWIDRSLSVNNGETVTKLGCYSVSAATYQAKLLQRTGAGVYTVLVSQALVHPGGGWADVTLTVPYAIPGGGGDFYVGIANPGGAETVGFTGDVPRSTFDGNAAGAGVAFSEAGASPTIAARYETAVPIMTLADDADNIDADPSGVTVYATEQAVGANPDRTLEVSIDNGATWVEAEYVEDFDFADRQVYRHFASMAGHAGSQLIVRYISDRVERNVYRLDAVVHP